MDSVNSLQLATAPRNPFDFSSLPPRPNRFLMPPRLNFFTPLVKTEEPEPKKATLENKPTAKFETMKTIEIYKDEKIASYGKL